MVDAIRVHCPTVYPHVKAGCMYNTTRARLELYAESCPALKGDFGPFFLGGGGGYNFLAQSEAATATSTLEAMLSQYTSGKSGEV